MDLLRPLPAEARRCTRCPGHAGDPAHTSHLAATSSTQHSPDRLIRHAVIMRDVTERFPLLDPLEHGFPFRGSDLPARISFGMRVARQRHKQRLVKGRYERIISGGGSGSVFLVDKQIASAGEEFVKWDTCQGRPMGRCPSVPLRLFMETSRINRTYVLLTRLLPLSTRSSVIPD
jgi:hypothetical protein